MKRFGYIFCLLLLCWIGQGCSSHAVREAEAVVAEADSLWQAGKMYGIDEGDSLALAQAYETLKDRHSSLFSFVHGTSFRQTYAHACYHYGKLLRAKDDPEEAMRCFINATHSDTRDYHILGRVYSNMGDMCHLAGEYQLSYEMFEQSANMFMKNGDTLSYYYALNDMAYELAEQGKKDSCFNITVNIRKISSSDSVLFAYCFMTQAQACLKCKQYDSLIFYAHKSKQYVSTMASSSLQLSQAYSYLGERDSAVYYALQVLDNTDELFDINNALYILTNDDMSQDMDDIRETAAKRSDTQKLLEIRRSKMSQAVLLLEQDHPSKPDWTWLYAIIATAVLTGSLFTWRHMAHRRKMRSQLEQMKEKQTDSILQSIKQHIDTTDINRTLHWKNYAQMKADADLYMGGIVRKLENYNLNETEIRLCILVLIGLNRLQIADTLPYASNSVGKLKDHTAKSLGTTGKNLRNFLLKMAIED